MATAIQSLAGDHSSCVTGSSPLVTMRGYPPCAGTIQTCGAPLMLEIKLTHLSSGENPGATALETRAIRATAAATSCDLPVAGAGFCCAPCASAAAARQFTTATMHT